MEKATATYYPSVNKVKINANSTQFIPGYVKYLFEYLKIPQNATIQFKDKTIKGGVVAWLKEEGH
jgi:hypothetical protein